MPQKSLFALGSVVALALAGCTAVPLPPSPPPQPKAPDFSIFRPEVQKITPDDPRPVFRKVFSDLGYLQIKKDDLETTAEYNVRLAALGVARTYVFQIPFELCHVMAYPDDNVYIIASKNCYRDTEVYGVPADYGITVAETKEPPNATRSLNKYGVMVDETEYNGVDYKLWLKNLFQLPATLRWSDKDMRYYTGFGLRVQVDNLDFRQLLRDKKIALAVRVRIDDVAKAFVRGRYDDTVRTFSPDADYYRYASSYLPATLLEAWVVDTSTQLSIVHWTDPSAATK